MVYPNAIRLVDLLFIFDKDQFLKNCIEIRIKRSLYEPKNRAFLSNFELAEFMTKIPKDLYKTPQLLHVIKQVVEQFEYSAEKEALEIESQKKKIIQEQKQEEDPV